MFVHTLKDDFYTTFKSSTADNGSEFLNSIMIERSCLKAGKIHIFISILL